MKVQKSTGEEKMKRKMLSILIVVLSASVLASADVLQVPADYNTIQSAVDAAKDGDEVVIADGIYTGNGNRDIDFLGKAITVRSENGPDICIINCKLQRH